MTEFTPVASGLGGALIGLSAATMLALNGRIAGISGILGGLLEGRDARAGRSWRGSFILGMVLGGVLLTSLAPAAVPTMTDAPLWQLVVAGLLVGVGTRIGGGCTSGHGVCGVSRMSRRSLTATAIFMSAAMVTVFLTRHVFEVGVVP